MGLLLSTHVGSVTQSEFEIDSKSRSNPLMRVTNMREDNPVRS